MAGISGKWNCRGMQQECSFDGLQRGSQSQCCACPAGTVPALWTENCSTHPPPRYEFDTYVDTFRHRSSNLLWCIRSPCWLLSCDADVRLIRYQYTYTHRPYWFLLDQHHIWNRGSGRWYDEAANPTSLLPPKIHVQQLPCDRCRSDVRQQWDRSSWETRMVIIAICNW